MNKQLEINERLSKRFMEMTMQLVEELDAEGDEEALATLPTVMLTTGLLALCRTTPADVVIGVLETLKVKVECGDFSSNQ